MREIEIKIKDITYQELESALNTLGLVNMSNGKEFKYLHVASGALVSLRKKEPHATIYPAFVVGIATILEGYGVISDARVLMNLIESQRAIECATA